MCENVYVQIVSASQHFIWAPAKTCHRMKTSLLLNEYLQ